VTKVKEQTDDILRLQEQIDVLQQKCESLKDGYQLLKQELRKRVNDIADLKEESPLVATIQKLQNQISLLAGLSLDGQEARIWVEETRED